ncbi:MAG: Ribosomal protein S12 methylthiotransferase RimO [Chlamydiae bacterium]|nr:Ribosomal protein S12 methylthiotransferase RimO [Chlamydiota bacterium]
MPRKKTKSRFHTSGNKISFISLGCPRNLVDSEVMLGILLKAGYEPSEIPEEADYLIINTCGFLQSARDESLAAIQETIEIKKETTKVIVTGCMVQRHSDEITKQFPKVDYLLGSGDVNGILKAVQSTEKGAEITSAKSYLEAGEVPRQLSTPQHYAYLKIAEGCRKRCSYCIIPEIKGPLRSKSVEQVLKEFRVLLDQGVKEVILIAQDLGDWGKDLGFRRSEGLAHLLREILNEKTDFWLRLLYLYPDEMSEELIQIIKNDKRICPYVDMPIQHVNDDLLRSMSRTTSKEDIIRMITIMRKEIPDMTIRTSLIVGFPGETEEQFEELEQFLKEFQLDNVGIFKYSREPGSRAAELPNQISEENKERRYQQLMKVQQEIVEKNNQRMVGKKLEAFVEGYHPESSLLMSARHRGQCPEVDGQIIINDGRKVQAFGKKYLVEITDVAGYDLIGRVIKSLEKSSPLAQVPKA